MTTENKTTTDTWDTFLTEEPVEGENYIKPNIEIKLSKEKRQACREIVREIKDFGVSQREILYLIYLLSLELENTETMKALVKAIGENREKIPIDILEKPKGSSLIIPGNKD